MFRFDGQNIFRFIRNKIKPRSVITSININLGSLYLASVVMKRGYDVSVSICCKYDFDRTFREYNPDILLISAMDIQAKSAIYIAKTAKSIKKSVKIIMGGYFPTACYEELLKELPWLDFAVIGEGISTLEDILLYYEGKIKSKGRIKGVAFVRKGKIVFTGYRELVNLDTIPFPARFLIKNVESYLITSLGCFYNCRFCSIKNFYKRVHRKRSIKNVVEEISYIRNIFKGNFINKIFIMDDDFLLDKNTLYELEARLAKCSLEKMRFSCMMRLDQLIVPGTLEQLERLNFLKVKVGLQNISEEVLNYFRVGINKSHIKKLIRLLKRNKKIKIRLFYIINSGLSTETSASIRKNLMDFLFLIKGINNIQVDSSILFPFSGSDVGGKSPFCQFAYSYSENVGYVSNETVSDLELNKIYSEFIHELNKRGQSNDRKLNIIFKAIDNFFLFLTSSLQAKTKIRMVFDSIGWFFIAFTKMKRPPDYIKKRIEQKYFL